MRSKKNVPGSGGMVWKRSWQYTRLSSTSGIAAENAALPLVNVAKRLRLGKNARRASLAIDHWNIGQHSKNGLAVSWSQWLSLWEDP